MTTAGASARNMRMKVMIAVMCGALLVYLALLGRTAALFDMVPTELDSDPGDWRRWYRLARAYDYAGDRGRAREAMKKAAHLRGHQ